MEVEKQKRMTRYCSNITLKIPGVGYVCIEESVDTIFNMGCGGGVQRPPPHGLWVKKIGHGREG